MCWSPTLKWAAPRRVRLFTETLKRVTVLLFLHNQIGHVASQAELAGVQLVGSRFRRTLASVPNNRRMDTSGPRPPGQHERERKGLCSKLAHTHTHTHTHIPCPLLTNSSAQRIGRGAVKPPVNRKPPLHS